VRGDHRSSEPEPQAYALYAALNSPRVPGEFIEAATAIANEALIDIISGVKVVHRMRRCVHERHVPAMDEYGNIVFVPLRAYTYIGISCADKPERD
jgi:hypothetical protein